MAWPINANHIFIAISIYMFFFDCKLLEIKFCNLSQKLAIKMILLSTLSHKCTNCNNSRSWKIDGVFIILKQKSPPIKTQLWPSSTSAQLTLFWVEDWTKWPPEFSCNMNYPMILWTSTAKFRCFFCLSWKQNTRKI